MSTISNARLMSEGSQIVDYFEEEKEKIERKRLKQLAKQPLDAELIKSGLTHLGRTYNNARHAFLTLNIQNKDLVSIVVSQTGFNRCRALTSTNICRTSTCPRTT
jgi:hypothetical protein